MTSLDTHRSLWFSEKAKRYQLIADKRAAVAEHPKQQLDLPDEMGTDKKASGSNASRTTLIACLSVGIILLALVASLVLMAYRRKGKQRQKLYEQVPEEGMASRKSSMKPNDPTLYAQNRSIDFVVPNMTTALAPISSPCQDNISISSLGSSPEIPLWAKLAIMDNSGSQSSLVLPGLSVLGGLNPELYRVGNDCEQPEEVTFPDGHRGRLWLDLDYEAVSERLSVKLVKAKNLPSRTYGSVNSCDPFVRLSLIPDDRRYLQSKLKKKTCNPKFDETFIFQIPVKAMEERSLKLTVYDNDRGKRHNVLGHILFPLKEVEITSNERMILWKDLETEVQEVMSNTGDVLVSLCYNQTLERLTVTVFEGRSLRFPEGSTPVDTYVKVTFLIENKPVKSKKTASAKKSAEPKYNESFNFKVSPGNLQSASVLLQVAMTGNSTKDKVLGRIVLGSYMFARGKASDHWNEVILAAGHKQIRHWHKLM